MEKLDALCLYGTLQADVLQDEQHGQHIHQRADLLFLGLAGDHIDDGPGNHTNGNALRDAVRSGHGQDGQEGAIYLNEDLTVIGKLETACDAVISLPTVSRIHAKIRKKEENYFLSDMNSRNGTSVNGRLLRPDEEYQLEPEDEVDFAQARYIFLE